MANQAWLSRLWLRWTLPYLFPLHRGSGLFASEESGAGVISVQTVPVTPQPLVNCTFAELTDARAPVNREGFRVVKQVSGCSHNDPKTRQRVCEALRIEKRHAGRLIRAVFSRRAQQQ